MIDESERQREGLASVDLDQKDLQVGTRGRGGRCYVLEASGTFTSLCKQDCFTAGGLHSSWLFGVFKGGDASADDIYFFFFA